MSARHAVPTGAPPGERLVQVGAAVFAVGLGAVVLAVVPTVVTGSEPPLPVVVAAGALLPLGFGLALLGLLRRARTARRLARRARRQQEQREARLSAGGPGPESPRSSTPS